jgi:hypothetical protein
MVYSENRRNGLLELDILGSWYPADVRVGHDLPRTFIVCMCA